MKTLLKLFSVLSLLFFVACSSSQPPVALPNDVAPNSCRITGTVVQIKDFNDPSLTCIANPCTAKIKIDNVQKVGMSFKTPLIKGDTIKVNFVLSKSNSLSRDFRGLKIGDKFTGDVERVEVIQLENAKDKFEYRISKFIFND